MQRALVVMVGTALSVALIFWLAHQQPPAARIAAKMAGESWFRIQLNQEHVGYMYNRTYRDGEGDWHFVTTTHFLLESNTPNTIVKHLTFSAKPPYALVDAIYTNESRSQALITQVKRTTQGYVARLQRSGQRSETVLDWQYNLDTFLGIEQWLADDKPIAADEFTTKSLDFERLRITTRGYRVVELNEQGYLVETSAPFSATQTQLNANYQPIRLNMAGIFDVIATDEADAIALRKMRRKTTYLFAANQRLDNHTEITSLNLRMSAPPGLDLPNKWALTANPIISSGNTDQFLGEELAYPITHPDIQALVQQSLSSANASSKSVVHSLLDTAHQQLIYAEDEPAGTVLTAMAEGRGECTDYADLFTTLARAAGLPARTVYGLAYKDGPQPAFMFHAWNEVYAQGVWQSVDPTWGQTQVDATHIPLTDAQAATMMLANNIGNVEFEVLNYSYD